MRQTTYRHNTPCGRLSGERLSCAFYCPAREAPGHHAFTQIDLADGQQDTVVHVRPAGDDGDVEAVFLIGAVGERLIEAAMLGLSHPVGGETHLVERPRDARPGQRGDRDGKTGNETCKAHSVFPFGRSAFTE
jgi:hypothetical protein